MKSSGWLIDWKGGATVKLPYHIMKGSAAEMLEMKVLAMGYDEDLIPRWPVWALAIAR